MIPVFKPHVDADTIKAAVDALHLGWLGMGSYVRDFEIELARMLELPEDRTVVAVNTCTSALHLALLSAGVGPGDEVITPALNNIGDFQAIGMCGARPVFVDVREDDLAIDPDLIAAAITPQTKAIICLHYMGIPCRIDEIYKIASAHGLPVIEDAAHATGSRTRSRRIGSYGDFACFSFDAIKTVTCIDGGAVVLPRDRAAGLFPKRLLGMTQSNERLYSNSRAYDFDVFEQGFRYHLANLHAAIGLTQLRALPTFIRNRASYARLYNEAFRDMAGVIAPKTDFVDVSLFHYVLRITEGRRDEFRQHLRDRGVDTGVHWLPGHWFSWLENCRGAKTLPLTDRVASEIVTLPLWSNMDEQSIQGVVNAVRSFEGRGRVSVATRATRVADWLRLVKTGGLPDHAIPVPGHPEVQLRAVDTGAPSERDVRLLSEWRNRHVKSFLTEFDATPPRTRRWLMDSVRNDDSRVLFMVDDHQTGESLGYIGIAAIDWESRSAEADSVVRGESGKPGLMSAALGALLDWSARELDLKSFSVRVLADNPALEFYERFGFREQRRARLVSDHSSDGLVWREGDHAGRDAPARELVYMTLAERGAPATKSP